MFLEVVGTKTLKVQNIIYVHISNASLLNLTQPKANKTNFFLMYTDLLIHILINVIYGVTLRHFIVKMLLFDVRFQVELPSFQ